MQGKRFSSSFWLRSTVAAALLVGLVVIAMLGYAEMRSSHYQAKYFANLAAKASFTVGPGPSPAIRFPAHAPYDDRLGYANLPIYLERLKTRSFEIASQARISQGMADIVDNGYFAPYREKMQAGLDVVDCHDESLFRERYPRRIYQRFEDIPPILVHSLLFIENRELLDPTHPKRNPAVEWDRLANALVTRGVNTVTGAGRTSGGSTLATQIEKYRHSSEGRTASMQEKLQQMISASLRAYLQGEDTSEVRRQIVLHYINTMPLSARAGFGEVHGVGDGLWVWYRRDFTEANRLMLQAPDANELAAQAHAYKQALSLMISQRRPSYYFDGREDELEQLTDSHLRLLAGAGIVPAALRDAALQVKLGRRTDRTPAPPISFVKQKAANAVRTQLAGLLGAARLYDLDRIDLAATSTLDAPTQDAVSDVLRSLRDPAVAKEAGLNAKQLLAKGDPAKVIYSFTLYERGADANYLRVQTDNVDQPLNINEGAKLDLGSTAKLRTLVTYLDIVEKLHRRLSPLDRIQLAALGIDRKDVLTRWAAEHLMQAKDTSLEAMLEAALQRRYSAATGEGFMTGGGLQHYSNFNREDDRKIISVRDGLRNSVNLVFIRLMRDIVHHYMFNSPGASASLLKDPDDPRRAAYLKRFADHEGQIFMRRFLVKYRGKTEADAVTTLLDNMRPSPSRLAAVFRTIEPEASLDTFSAFIKANLPKNIDPDDDKLERLYQQYAPQKMSLADRGYVAGIHPLELWLVGYLRDHPQASQTEVMQASAAERQTVYSWLFSTRRKYAQDKRILGLLETEGFLEIHRQWEQTGYPFDSLVPSFGTALGASADRPAALAELMGILVNDGMRLPTMRIRKLHFAAATPYETELHFKPGQPERVLAPEVAKAVRDAMNLVVEEGTAKRVKSAFVRPDGSTITVGGKTGTGDQRFNTYGAGGRLLESRVVNRSATFVFNIDERFFGTVIAYVPGPQAANYDFTSGLSLQLLKVLAPKLNPLVNRATATDLPAGACAD